MIRIFQGSFLITTEAGTADRLLMFVLTPLISCKKNWKDRLATFDHYFHLIRPPPKLSLSRKHCTSTRKLYGHFLVSHLSLYLRAIWLVCAVVGDLQKTFTTGIHVKACVVDQCCAVRFFPCRQIMVLCPKIITSNFSNIMVEFTKFVCVFYAKLSVQSTKKTHPSIDSYLKKRQMVWTIAFPGRCNELRNDRNYSLNICFLKKKFRFVRRASLTLKVLCNDASIVLRSFFSLDVWKILEKNKYCSQLAFLTTSYCWV